MRGLELVKNKQLLSKLGYITPNPSTLQLLRDNHTFDVINPATSEILLKLPRMGINEVNLGIDAANQAFLKWVCHYVNVMFKCEYTIINIHHYNNFLSNINLREILMLTKDQNSY